MTQGKGCPFCSAQEALARNEHAYMIYDRYPVTRGHILVITARHRENFFQTSAEERLAMLRLIDEAKLLLDTAFGPHGYNIGFNVGENAGKKIMHAHVHVIPRYKGDAPNWRGQLQGVARTESGH